MTMFPVTGTAPIDWGCVFNCGKPSDATSIRVEMNLHEGKFVAHQNHAEYEHGGSLIHAERVSGVAHVECYRAWYEQTYRTPFTMSG